MIILNMAKANDSGNRRLRFQLGTLQRCCLDDEVCDTTQTITKIDSHLLHLAPWYEMIYDQA